MLTALKFCAGSVAKKDFIPSLSHFVIEHGRIRGFNGVMALSSPIPFDIACKPKADVLIKAIANCTDTVQLAMTKAGRLSVKSGNFKVFINCIEEETPHALPEGVVTHFDGQALLDGLKAVAPFIGNDASRRWAHGVLVKDQCLFATNNVMLVQYWFGKGFPATINLPRDAVREMIRINEAPIFAQIAEGNVTFHYTGERWLRTQLYDSESWPDLGRILNKDSVQQPIDPALFAALSVVKPHVDQHGSIIFTQDGITTHPDEDEGASYDVPGLVNEGKYNIAFLELLEGTAKTIDWSAYPSACIFMNDRLRGAIIGLRK